MTPQSKNTARHRAYYIGLFLFSCYLLGYRGGFHSVDEVSMFAVTESLVKFGQVNTDSMAWTQWTTSQAEAQGFFGATGQVYSKKGLALSLAQAPLYGLALYLPGVGLLQTVSLLNALLTAATAALLYLFAYRLDPTPSPRALFVALSFGLATISTVYAKYLFSEPLAGFFITLTAYMLFTYQQEGGWRHVVIAGLAAGLSVMTRANNLFLLPAFGLYLWWIIPKKSRLSVLFPLLLFMVSIALSGIVMLAYNYARSGDPFKTGYDLSLFTPNVLLGLYKLLFSPLRGLFIYSPLLILALPGWVSLRRSHPAEAWLMAACVGCTLALFSAWSSGEGLSWGSRFLVPLVPMLTLCLTPLIPLGQPRRPIHFIFYALLLISCLIQLLALAINPWVYLNELQTHFGGQFFLEKTTALYDFRYSQIVGQLHTWSVTHSDLAWWQPWSLDLIALGVSLSLVCLNGAGVWYAFFTPRPLSARLLTLLTLLLTYALLYRYQQTDLQFGLPDDPYSQALTTVVQTTGEAIPVITVAPYHYHVPMNRFKAAVPLLGLAPQRPPLPDTAIPLLRHYTQPESVWLITVGYSPAAPDNMAEQWLTFNAYKATEQWFGDTRLLRYSTETPAMRHSLNVLLGQELRLLEATYSPQRQAGQLLPIKLTWRVLRSPQADYHLFLQLLNAQGQLVAQFDNPPNGGYTNSSTWFAGQQLVSRAALTLPPDLPAAPYQLIGGLYDPTTQQRLTPQGGGDFVELGLITIQ